MNQDRSLVRWQAFLRSPQGRRYLTQTQTLRQPRRLSLLELAIFLLICAGSGFAFGAFLALVTN